MTILAKVRKEYDHNYRQLRRIVREMGGDRRIKDHRQTRSGLYLKLKELQLREHHLNHLENVIRGENI